MPRSDSSVSLRRARSAGPSAYRRTDTPAERIGHQVFGECLQEDVLTFQQRIAQAFRPVEFRAVIHHARGIDGDAGILDAPFAGRIEIFEREPQRIDHAVARRTRGALAMFLHSLANRQHFTRGSRGGFGQQRYIRRRWRRW